MNRPIKGTIIFAFISGFSMVLIALILNYFLDWNTALKMILWFYISIYGFLLIRWSNSIIRPFIFPVVLLLGAALWPQTSSGFFLLSLGILSWVRTGICFQTTPLRGVGGEFITFVGGICILFLSGSDSLTVWALKIFLFFMIQTLYFFIIPFRPEASRENMVDDHFERAFAKAEKLLKVIS